MKTVVILFASFITLALGAHNAQAQSRGRVLVDNAIIWRTDSSIAAGTVKAGTVLELTGRTDRWYEVVLPNGVPGGGTARRGLIARTQVELLPGSPEPPLLSTRGTPLRPALDTPAPRRPRTVGLPLRTYIEVNVLYQATKNDFTQTTTFQRNVEQGQFSTTYSVDSGLAFAVGGGGLITPYFGVGATVTRFSRSTPAAFTASIPHPFFFNQPRTVTATIDGLSREEFALHGQARVLVPIGSHLRISAFGGPSVVRLAADIVTDFSFSESYPYDVATFGSATTTHAVKTALGYNVGADATIYISRKVGVGVMGMFSRAPVSLPPQNDQTLDVDTGGVQIGAGMRLRF